MKKTPELLSPAGTMDSVFAAVNNGCNAIYIGGKEFSARQYAGNFDIVELNEICDYCHLRDVKVYVTVNTLYKDKELIEFLEFVGKLYEIGVDALIIQDLGAMDIISKNYPDFKFHASTQLTANNLEDVNFFASSGFSKVVLSRELSIDEITYITQNTTTDIETFIHGALCVSYSGQCLMSSMLGGRSGNRGRCAQTCRLPFTLYKDYNKVEEGHLLSPKDIQTINILPMLIDAGISSFKIEGRMKNPEYVAGVTAIYRKYIDMYMNSPSEYKVEDKDLKMLLQLFNRGGFSEGYFASYSGKDMMSVERPKSWGLKTGIVDNYDKRYGRVSIRTREPLIPGDGIEIWTQKGPHVGSGISKSSKAGEVISLIIQGDINKNDVVYKTNDKLLGDTLKKTWEKDSRKKEIYGYFESEINKPMRFSLWDNEGHKVTVEGETVQMAATRPTDSDKIEKQLKKMGNTSFIIEKLDLRIDENIYIGISDLNDIRRRTSEELGKKIVESFKRDNKGTKFYPTINKGNKVTNKKINVLVTNILQYKAAITEENINAIIFELDDDFKESLDSIIKECHDKEIEVYVAYPRVYRQISSDIYKGFIEKLKTSDINGFLVRSGGQLAEVLESGKKIITDSSFNILNAQSVEFLKEIGADIICISPELNLGEISTTANSTCEMIGYGHLQLMTTHQCPIGNYDGDKGNSRYCKRKLEAKEYYLKDRKGMEFPILTDCNQCVSYILNGNPIFTLKFFDEILNSPTGYLRLNFTVEDGAMVSRIINAYNKKMADNECIDAEMARLFEEIGANGSTKGHYFRGIE